MKPNLVLNGEVLICIFCVFQLLSSTNRKETAVNGGGAKVHNDYLSFYFIFIYLFFSWV